MLALIKVAGSIANLTLVDCNVHSAAAFLVLWPALPHLRIRGLSPAHGGSQPESFGAILGGLVVWKYLFTLDIGFKMNARRHPATPKWST